MGGRLSVGGQDLICLCNGECNKLNRPLAAIVCLFWLCLCMCECVCCVTVSVSLGACCAHLPNAKILLSLFHRFFSLCHVTEGWFSLPNKVETLLPLMQLVIYGSLIM